MTVGFHSPLPPARTGVADYAAKLLPALRAHCRVDLNATRAGVHLYHLGNNPLHRDIYQRALETPGVTVLHDANLHHFFLGILDRESYIEEFVYNYGEWHRDLAAELWTQRARSSVDPRYFRYPLLRRIAETARTVIVHNPAARRAVLAHAPNARIIEIPHFFEPPPAPSECDVIRLRQSFQLPPTTLLAGVFGHLRESKRIHSILRAIDVLQSAGTRIALLLAGDVVSTSLARALEPCSSNPSILRVPYLAEPRFLLHTAAVDVCINLRYPSSAESSGIAARLMGAGKPVILTAGEDAPFPETACLRVDPGPAESAMLAAWLDWLARDPNSARAIGRRAAAFIRQHHSLARVTSLYLQALR